MNGWNISILFKSLIRWVGMFNELIHGHDPLSFMRDNGPHQLTNCQVSCIYCKFHHWCTTWWRVTKLYFNFDRFRVLLTGCLDSTNVFLIWGSAMHASTFHNNSICIGWWIRLLARWQPVVLNWEWWLAVAIIEYDAEPQLQEKMVIKGQKLKSTKTTSVWGMI